MFKVTGLGYWNNSFSDMKHYKLKLFLVFCFQCQEYNLEIKMMDSKATREEAMFSAMNTKASKIILSNLHSHSLQWY